MNYSEEEKKAIEILQEFKKTGYHTLRLKYNEDRIHTNKLIERALETVLNLIETQKAELERLKEYKKISELTKISCCTAQNCEALNNAIREGLENNKLKEEIEKRDKMIDEMAEDIIDYEKDLKYEEPFSSIDEVVGYYRRDIIPEQNQ